MKFSLSLSLGVLLAGCAAPRTENVRACCRPHLAMTADPATQGSVYELAAKWQDDAGRAVQLSDLRGRPVVISMFYAACEGICVITRDDMKDIEASLPAALRSQVQFVLVTLDPKRDTVKSLRSYRSQEELPEDRWRLLRGDPDSTTKLAERLGVGFGRDGSGRFVHSSQIVVLDQMGRIIQSQDGVHANLVAAGKVLEQALDTPVQ